MTDVLRGWILVAAAVGSMSCGDYPLCAEWIDTRLEYGIELLSPVDAPAGSPPGFAFLYDQWPEPTCGDGAPMATGDTLYTRFTRNPDLDGNAPCSRAGMAPSLEAFGLEIDHSVVGGIGVGVGGFSMDADRYVRTSVECGGGMRIALSGVRSEHMALFGPAAPSDYILVRGFEDPLVACIAPNAVGGGSGNCWDSWFVKITDENGRVITKHPDGGI